MWCGSHRRNVLARLLTFAILKDLEDYDESTTRCGSEESCYGRADGAPIQPVGERK